MKRLGSWSAQGEQPRWAATSLPGLAGLGMGTKSGVGDGEEACEGSACFYGGVAIVFSVTGPRSRVLAERLMTPRKGPLEPSSRPLSSSAAPGVQPLLLGSGKFTPRATAGGKRGAASAPASATSNPVSVRLSVCVGLCHGPDPTVGAKHSCPACFS